MYLCKVGSFKALATTKSEAMTLDEGLSMWLLTSSPLDTHPRVLEVRYIVDQFLIPLKHLHTGFHSACLRLHPHLQRKSFFANPPAFLFFCFFLAVSSSDWVRYNLQTVYLGFYMLNLHKYAHTFQRIFWIFVFCTGSIVHFCS